MAFIKLIVLIAITVCLRSALGSITRPSFFFIEKVIKQCFKDSIIKNCQKNPLSIKECSDQFNKIQSDLIERCKGTVRYYLYEKCEEDFFIQLNNPSFSNELKKCRNETQYLVEQNLPPSVYIQTIKNCFDDNLNPLKFKASDIQNFYSIRDDLLKCGNLIKQDEIQRCEYKALTQTVQYDFPQVILSCIERKSQLSYQERFPKIEKVPFALFDGLFRSCAHTSMFKECPDIKKPECLDRYSEIVANMVTFCKKASTDRLMAMCEELALLSNDIQTDSSKYKELLSCKKSNEQSYVNDYNSLIKQ